ncbi:unnamed protein product, partial [Rotaria sp. Silwood2]
DSGLDPKLYHFISDEIKHRESLTRYASYDCLSMQQLIFKLNIMQQQELIITSSKDIIITTSNGITAIPFDNDQHNLPTAQTNEAISTEGVPNNHTNELEIISSDDGVPGEQRHLRQEILTKEERKKIHNRSCTLKQRKKHYRYEIIRRGIDHRFTITKIKKYYMN